jgi:hypothetical protein
MSVLQGEQVFFCTFFYFFWRFFHTPVQLQRRAFRRSVAPPLPEEWSMGHGNPHGRCICGDSAFRVALHVPSLDQDLQNPTATCAATNSTWSAGTARWPSKKATSGCGMCILVHEGRGSASLIGFATVHRHQNRFFCSLGL